MIGKSDVYRRALYALGLIAAIVIPVRAFAQETAITRIDLPLGRAYPYRAAEVITRVTVANPSVADAVVVSEREIVVWEPIGGYRTLVVQQSAEAGRETLQVIGLSASQRPG